MTSRQTTTTTTTRESAHAMELGHDAHWTRGDTRVMTNCGAERGGEKIFDLGIAGFGDRGNGLSVRLFCILF